MAMQAQIQALLAAIEVEGAIERSNIEVAQLPIFSGNVRNKAGFITAYRLFLKMKIRKTAVEI